MKRRQRAPKGTGHLMRQTGKNIWLMQYTDEEGNRRIRTTGKTLESEARTVLNKRLTAVAEAIKTGGSVDHNAEGHGSHNSKSGPCGFEDGVTLWKNFQIAKHRSGLDQGLGIIDNHLRPYFGARRLSTIQNADLVAYRVRRLEQGAEDATINGELSIYRRFFNLAYESGRFVGKVPTFPILSDKELKNARQGFFEWEQYSAMRKRLPSFLKRAATFMYYTGWRGASETALLDFADLDERAGTITLRDSKNGEGRVFPYRMLPGLVECIEEAKQHRDRLRKKGIIVARLFTDDEGQPLTDNPSGSRRTGNLRKPVRAAWALACKKAGIADRKPHDFRRTAARNLVDAGIDQKTARLLTGHKTNHVFERYLIRNTSDLAHAVSRLAAAQEAIQQEEKPALGLVAKRTRRRR